MTKAVDRRELARVYMGGLAHVHTRLSNHPGHRESDQTMTSFVRALVEHGLAGRPGAPIAYVMFNDHSSDPGRPRRLGRYSLRARALRRARQQLTILGVPILHGLEVSLLPEGGTDLTPRLGKECRLVIASRHQLPDAMNESPRAVEKLLMAACDDPDVDVLGHPARFIEGLRGVDWPKVMRRAAQTGTAIEVNLNIFPDPEREPGRTRFWRGWLDTLNASGAMVFLGTDLHNSFQLHRFLTDWRNLNRATGPNRLAACLAALAAGGIGPERVVTAEYGRLAEWLAQSKPERAAKAHYKGRDAAAD